MQDEQPKKKPLSEIGHLFLSSVRDQHLGGLPRPQRVPPGGAPQARPDASRDLTPAEYARVLAASDGPDAAAPRRNPPVTAVIGEHLSGTQRARVTDYARHLVAVTGGRVGLIELDASEFRLVCFEPGEPRGDGGRGPADEALRAECFDARAMAEAVEEMSFDVDRWLLLMPSPRVPEAQPLLKLVDHWVLLSTCDHDGIVASYRMLKGLAELHRPRLSLAVLDASDAAHADRVYRKLAGVCEQFLDRSLEAEPAVLHASAVCEHTVMLCHPTRDKAQLGNPPQWGIVTDFLARAKAATGAVAPAAAAPVQPETDGATQRVLVSDMVVPAAAAMPAPAAEEMTMPEPMPNNKNDATPAPAAAPAAAAQDGLAEVLDLPSADASAEQIVNAVLRQDGAAMLECPVRPPMCAEARLAVSRDRSVVLLAVAKRGLSELNEIGQAYRWLIENRSLIGMAVPQLAIDANQPPKLRLLVDQCDAGAEALQPMLTGDHVAVQSYRRVRWGGKAGLLLEAA